MARRLPNPLGQFSKRFDIDTNVFKTNMGKAYVFDFIKYFEAVFDGLVVMREHEDKVHKLTLCWTFQNRCCTINIFLAA